MQSSSAGSPQSSARLSCPRAPGSSGVASGMSVDPEEACPGRLLPWRAWCQAPTASLPAPGAPGDKPPHMPPPPPQTQGHPSSAHATHTGTAVSPSCVCHRRVPGLSAVRHALRPQQPGAPNPVESRRDGCADRRPGRPGEALTQSKPNPLPLSTTAYGPYGSSTAASPKLWAGAPAGSATESCRQPPPPPLKRRVLAAHPLHERGAARTLALYATVPFRPRLSR